MVDVDIAVLFCKKNSIIDCSRYNSLMKMGISTFEKLEKLEKLLNKFIVLILVAVTD